MAGIDKTYVKTWKEFQEMKDWIFEHPYFKTNTGYIVETANCLIGGWEKENFDGEVYRPILSTSLLEDYILIKHCDLPFYQERMIECYGVEEVEAIKNGTSDYDTFSKEGKYGTRAKIISAPSIRVNRPCMGYWWVELREPEGVNSLLYNEELDRWYWADEQGDGNTNVAHIKTLKTILRKIRHWQLPKGTIVLVKGHFVGEDYKILVK